MLTENKSKQSERLQSLDALRGFDMFWIMGGEHIFIALGAATGLPLLEWWANQMTHVKWHGFHAYDMIFPLFLFIAGISFPFSMKKRLAKEGNKKGLYRHVLKRGLLLVLIGIVYNNGVRFDFENMRYASVLGRIGLAWMFAALIFMNTNLKSRIIWTVGILLSYWAIMASFHAPDLGDTDHYSVNGNIASYIDRILLPGKFCCYEVGDNEGLLSTIPAIATALLGMLTGSFLQTNKTPKQKVGYMVGAAVILMGIGQLWNLVMPINKNLWTSSFVCWVGGLSLLLFAIFYLIIDVWKISKWAFPLVVIGVNPITIYLAQNIIGFRNATDFFFDGFAKLFPKPWENFFWHVGLVIVAWVFLYILYRKKIFLKL